MPPVFPGSTYALGLCLCVCLLIFLSVCLSVCLSVYQSVCLSKSLYMYLCLAVCICLFLPLSPSLSLILNICGVDLADQGSRARYQAIQVISWDSKSVPFPIEAHYPKYASFIRNHYMRRSRMFCQRGPDPLSPLWIRTCTTSSYE